MSGMAKCDQDDFNLRTAEQVRGDSWAKYFEELGLGVLTKEVYDRTLRSFDGFYGDFHERYLKSDAGPILELGVGSGLSALPLIARGYTIIGLDNDLEALDMCRENVQFSSAPDKLTLVQADLYDPDWYRQFVDQNIQGIVSYGVLEHFTEQYLKTLIPQHFAIASRAIAMMPINTPRTLVTYGATGKEDGDVSSANGIFRIFRTEKYWKENILQANSCQIIGSKRFSNLSSMVGACDMVVFVLEKRFKTIFKLENDDQRTITLGVDLSLHTRKNRYKQVKYSFIP